MQVQFINAELEFQNPITPFSHIWPFAYGEPALGLSPLLCAVLTAAGAGCCHQLWSRDLARCRLSAASEVSDAATQQSAVSCLCRGIDELG